MIYYVFEEGKKTFYKTHTLEEAIASNTPKRVFRHVQGIPNPWWVQEYRGRRGAWGPVSYLDKKANGRLVLTDKTRRS